VTVHYERRPVAARPCSSVAAALPPLASRLTGTPPTGIAGNSKAYASTRVCGGRGWAPESAPLRDPDVRQMRVGRQPTRPQCVRTPTVMVPRHIWPKPAPLRSTRRR